MDFTKMNTSNVSVIRANRNITLRQKRTFRSNSPDLASLLNEGEKIFKGLIHSNQNVNLPIYSKSSKDFVNFAINDSKFQELIVETITSSSDQLLLNNLIKTLSCFFSRISDTNVINLIDVGLPLALINLLESNNESLILSALSLINISVSSCDYARDCFISYGILSICLPLIQFQSLVEPTCITLCSFFKHPSPLEFETISEFVKPLLEFVANVSKQTIKIILSTFYQMYLKCHSIVITFYKMNIHLLVVQLLNDPLLVEEAIDVVGVLCNAESIYVKSLMELNLLQKLFDLYNQNCLYSLFWIFSNLIDSATIYVQPYFSVDFCINSAFLALQPSSQVKLEAALFISKIIFFSERNEISKFVHEYIIELFASVLNNDDEESVTFYLQVIQRLIQHSIYEGKQLQTFIDSDLLIAIDELKQSELGNISSFAQVLLNYFH